MALAAEAGARGDPPFGALLVDPSGAVVARASNRQVSGEDPTAQAHMDPDLGVAEVFARARRPPRVIAGVLTAESAALIAGFRAGAEAGDLID